METPYVLLLFWSCDDFYDLTPSFPAGWTAEVLYNLLYLCLGFRSAVWADEGSAGHDVEAETSQNEQGTSPGVRLHQQLEERVKSEGRQTDAGEAQS